MPDTQRANASAADGSNLTAVRFEHTREFPGILQHLRAALAVTTYQAGKLAVVGVEGDRLQFSFHGVEQAMGVAVGPHALALGSRRDIHLLRAAHDIAPSLKPAGTWDAAWLTRHSFRTANIHAHELAWGADGLWVVNTLFSCLCTLHEDYSFVPRWRPPFITELEANDRCHLNGLAMLDGRPKFVTAHAESNDPAGWRPVKATAGVVFDLNTGQTVAMLQFHSGVDELFAIEVLPNCLRPCIVGPHDTEGELADIWVVPLAARAPGQAAASPPPAPTAGQDPVQRCERLASQAESLQREGRWQEALQTYRRALEIQPQRASLHCNLGNLWQQLDDQHQAIACYERALQCDPACTPARQNLGYLLFNHGRTEEAVEQYDALLAADPSPLNQLLAAGLLPVVYDSAEAVRTWRQRMLDRLDQALAGGAEIDTASTLVPTSFFVAYQGCNDVQVMERIGRICRGPELIAAAGDRPLPPRSDGRLRVGFLSAYFRDHTIGRLNLGRVRRLDRQRFEVTVLSATARADAVAADFRAAADRFRQLPRDVAAARAAVADQDLDVLIFADVGMDSLTTTLAWSRMAPVQCVTWGHPDTTGSPHMDYFLSSELLDTDDADTHYIKFHPDFDPLLAGILQADPRAELVLLEGRVPAWTERLKSRFARTLPESGRRVRFLPALPREQFLRLLAAADVVLDPPHFGGGHTSYEALAMGTPLVTLPGALLRSRITQALYRKMQCSELIADSPRTFVDLAIRVATNEDTRRKLAGEILGRCSVLFEDPAEVHCLADWLWSLTSSAPTGGRPAVAGGAP